MADGTTRKLLDMIIRGKPNLRCAAAMVVGEIQPKGRPVIKALASAMQDPNHQLRRIAIDSIGAIGGREVIPHLLAIVRQGGEEAENAAAAISKVGSMGVKALMKEMQGGAPSVKKAITTALGKSGAQQALDTALYSLLDENTEVVDAARRSLEAEVKRADEAGRKHLAKRMVTFLSRREVLSRPTAVGASLRVLELLRAPAAEKMLWKWAASSYPAPIRAVALRALTKLPPPQGKTALKTLVKLLDEKDPSLVRPALEVLSKLKIPAAFVSRLLMLLDSPEPMVRIFSLRALSHADSVKVADAVLARLQHPDPEMRRVAEEVAAGLPSARKILAKQLLVYKDVAQCWAVVRILRREAGGIDGPTMKSLLARALDAVEKDESWSEPLLHFVRRMEPKKAFEMLRRRGLQLREKKKYAGAVRCLRLLTRDPEFTSADRWELALAGLMLSSRRIDSASRAADPCLGHFLTLAHMDHFNLLGRLKKERIVGQEEYYYIGYHFIERGDQRQLGQDFLKHLLKKWPRAKMAKKAREKLGLRS